MSTIDPDAHGLETLALRWNPRSMRATPEGAALLDAVNAAIADALNPLIDLEEYAPIILNATRCLDNDIDAILALNGITRAKSLSTGQARRMAVIAQALRSWRGAFRSLRSVVGALTGGPVIIRSWLTQRASLDESAWDLVVFTEPGYQDVSQVFLLGQNNSDYNAAQVESHVESLARTILDTTEYVECFTLTAWRDGFAGWAALGRVELIPSGVTGEFESVDMGIDVSGSGTTHRVTAPLTHDADAGRLWATVWFKTSDATDLSTWRFIIASNGATNPTAYGVKVNVGNGTLLLVRIDAGVDTTLGSFAFTIPDGDQGDWHRLDLLMVRETAAVKLRAYVDHNPSGWAQDLVLTPNGTKLEVLVEDASFPTGRLRLTAITAKQD